MPRFRDPSLLYGILTDAPPIPKGSLMSQPPMPPGSPGQPLPQPQPQSWPQQGMQPPADRVVDPDPDSIANWTPPPWTAGPDAPAGWTPPPWTARRQWLVTIRQVVLIVLLVLLGIGIGYWATVYEYDSVRDLAVGECFDYGNAEGEVLRQPCTVAHDGEIIGDVTLPEGPYPGDYGVDEAAYRACSHDFTYYVGKSPDETELDLDYWTPTESLWNGGDRLVVCEAVGFAGLQLTGTSKNSHR
jgi:Septum formation